jgi:hypothetical protein
MLGFEEALRREPPAQVMAAEHAPERGRIAADGGLLIDIPDPVAPPPPGARRPTP